MSGLIENLVAETIQKLNPKFPMPTTIVGLTMLPLKIYNNKRIEKNRDALIEEISKGNIPFDRLESDDFISAMWVIHMAIMRGAGINNIRLLARLLVGMETNSIPVYADQFLRYAGMLESLSIEEIQILGIFSRKLKECLTEENLNQKWGPVVYSKLNEVYQKTHQEFINSGLGTKENFAAYNAAILRTGFLIPEILTNGVAYYPSPLFAQLIRIIEINKNKVT